mgnify:CR=1 FL=1
MTKGYLIKTVLSLTMLSTVALAQENVDAIEKARQAKEAADKAAAEAAAAIVGQGGDLPFSTLRKAAHFTGGVPGLVDAVGTRAREKGTLPSQADELLASLGPVVDEIRGAVDIVHMERSKSVTLIARQALSGDYSIFENKSLSILPRTSLPKFPRSGKRKSRNHR